MLVLAVLIPALGFLFTRVVQQRLGIVILSAVVAHTAWHWMTERWAVVSKFPIPELDAAAVASLMRWAMVVIATVLFLWVMSGVVRRWEGLGSDARADAN